jgi:6,7-dimethyl-8-ribityllumazine synthase
MIKSFHKLLVPKREQEYAALVEFFEALGLRRGESWDGRRSKGVKFDAREAGVEIGIGKGFPDADLVIETDSAEVVYDTAKKRGFKISDEIADTDWGARLFTLDLPAGAGRLALFSYNEDWRAKNTVEGKLDATGLRFALVVSRFNAFVTERLLGGALDALQRLGAEAKNIKIVRVPGAFEIPSAARTLAKTKQYDAILCIGCLLRGDTAHYEVIANEATRGIGQSAQETGVPHAFAVLTCDTLEQAIDRAGLKSGNKGYEAALAAVEMAQLNRVVGRRSKVDGPSIKPSKSPTRATQPSSTNKGKGRKARAGSRRRR